MTALQLPVPPPFMWACERCADMLIDLDTALRRAATDPFHDGSAVVQGLLASHIAQTHSEAIPLPHGKGCQRCAFYSTQAEGRDIDDLWLEHLARDLFLPADVARHK